MTATQSEPPPNGKRPTPGCAKHLADTEQLVDDSRLQAAALRDLDRRADVQDTALGQIAAELGTCRRASERAADAAMGTLAAVQDLAKANAREHERITGRVEALESVRPSGHVSLDSDVDYDVGEDTKINMLAYNMPAIAAKLMAERSRADKAEAALAERSRHSDRVQALAVKASEVSVSKWRLVVGAVVALGTGGGIALLARLIGG